MAALLNKSKFGGIKPVTSTVQTEITETSTATPRPNPFAKKGLGKSSLLANKKPSLKKEEAKEVQEPVEITPPATPKKVLGAKKNLLAKKEVAESPEQTEAAEDMVAEANLGRDEAEIQAETEEIDITHSPEVEEEVSEVKEEEKPKSKKTTRNRKKKEPVESGLLDPQVDEKDRITLEEMDEIMRPIVAPTTAIWEQEKRDIREAMDKIKVQQNMDTVAVKACLSELDFLYSTIEPRLHEAKTVCRGTKESVEQVEIMSKVTGSNADERKANAIIACKNYTTPSGAVVNLYEYLHLITEKYDFYHDKMKEIDFKRSLLISYNSMLKIEG